MLKPTFPSLRRHGKKVGTSLLLSALAGGSLFLTSCTTEEGLIGGALAGAAIGGLVGHSQEHSYKRHRGHYDYDHGHYERYPRRSSYYAPRYSSYRGRGYDPYCYY